MRIVLDTNAFNGDVHADRDHFLILLASCLNGELMVVVPQLVLDELSRQYPERIEAIDRDLARAVKKHGRDARALRLAISELTVSPSVAPSAYGGSLRRHLLQYGVRIVASTVTADQLIAWAIHKRKPFKESGAGVQDAAIWSVVRQEARSDTVIFVTANTTDFASASDRTLLHPDLVQDLRNAGLSRDQVRLLPDVRTLIDEVVRPLTMPDYRAERLLSDPTLSRRFEEAISDALWYAPIDPDQFRIDLELVDNPQVTSVQLRDIRLLSARELAPTRLLLELEITATLDLELSVAADNAEELEYSAGIHVVDNSNNDYFIEASGSFEATLRLEATTNLDATSVEVEVLSAKGS